MLKQTQKLGTRTVAELYGLGYSTVPQWAKEYNIPYTKERGKIKFKPEDAALFEVIKQLKSQDAGMNTIRRRIGTDVLQQNQSGDVFGEQPKGLNPALQLDIRAEVKAALAESNELSEKYARATFEIGQLQERVRGLEQQLQVLPSSDELAQAKAENERLKMELANEKKKRWWQKLF
jgi:DNA-binding transcriptional MerR regulator